MTLYQQRYRVETARLRNWDYSFPGCYFVTICTENRKCWFGKIVNDHFVSFRIGRIALAHWQAIPTHYSHVKLDEFVVMPNHVHGILIIIIEIIEGKHVHSPGLGRPGHVLKAENLSEAVPKKGSLSAILRSYKSGVSRASRMSGFTSFAWQERFYDQILRSNASVNAVRDYIINNPRNWARDAENPYRTESGDVASYVSTLDCS